MFPKGPRDGKDQDAGLGGSPLPACPVYYSPQNANRMETTGPKGAWSVTRRWPNYEFF